MTPAAALTASNGTPAAPGRPLVALVGTGLTPYRVHFLRRLARELPEVEFHTLNTMHPAIEPWRLPPPPDLRFEHLDTRSAPARGWARWWAQWRLGARAIERLAALRPAAVVVSGYHHAGHLRVIAWAGRRGLPVLFASDSNVHADRARGLARAVKDRLVRWVVRTCQPLLVCGTLGERYFERYGARPGQCVYVPYEPDYERCAHVDASEAARVREQHRWSSQRRRLLFCGRLAEQKRPDLAVEAFAEVAHDFPDWDLVMVGDGPLREWLTYRAPPDLQHRVQYTGFVDRPETLCAIFHACHALVLSSDWEPWGVVVNEAVAANLPVVSTSVVGAAVELVRDGVNGRLVTPGSVRELAEALRDVMSPGRASAMAAAAPGVLADWRRRGDPVEGMRAALARVGVPGPARHVAGQPSSTKAPALGASARAYGATVAFVGGALTPYRIHLMRRLAREVPDLRPVTLMTGHPHLSPWKTTHVEGFTVEHLDPVPPPGPWWGRRLLNQWKVGTRALRILERERPAAVVLHSYNHVAHFRVMSWCRRRRVPCLMVTDSNIRGDKLRGPARLVKDRVVRWVVSHNDALLVCGSLGQAYFERYGARPGQCVYCPYEPDYELLQSITPSETEAVAARFGLRPDRRRFIFVARMVGAKRPDLLLDAFAQVAQGAPAWDLVMVGDGPLLEEMRRRVPAHLASRVTWTGFLGDQRVISALYRASDCMVLPSDFEPWAVVVNEAVAAGVAVVSSDVVGAAAELVRDGVNGRLFAAGDVAGLAAALRDVALEGHSERMKAQAPEVLAQWRARADPVRQLVAALGSLGVPVGAAQTAPAAPAEPAPAPV